MMRQIFSVFILMALVLSSVVGCASRAHRLGSSFWPEEFPAAAVPTVADHLADLMVANYPPGYTVLFLALSDNPKDELGPALETALRSRGFTLAPEKGGAALSIHYVLDRLDDETWYSRLTVSDGLSLTRTWRWAGDSLLMEAATKTGRTEKVDGQK